MAVGRPGNRCRRGAFDHAAHESPARYGMGNHTADLLASSLDDRSRAGRWLLPDRADYAVPHTRSRRTFERRNNPLVPRTPGRHRHATVLVEAARRDHHGWFGRQCRARRAQHLWWRRNRIVVVDKVRTLWTRAARPAPDADQRRGRRD